MLWLILGRHRHSQWRIERKLARARKKLLKVQRRRAIGFNVLALLWALVQWIRDADGPRHPQQELLPPRAMTLAETRGRGFWTFGRRMRQG
jgi:hypothetical protein